MSPTPGPTCVGPTFDPTLDQRVLRTVGFWLLPNDAHVEGVSGPLGRVLAFGSPQGRPDGQNASSGLPADHKRVGTLSGLRNTVDLTSKRENPLACTNER